MNNVEIHQLGSRQLAVVFNKHALKAIQQGGASGCQLKMGGKQLKFIFMRDTHFQQRAAEFRQMVAKEEPKTFWQRIRGWFTWRKQ